MENIRKLLQNYRTYEPSERCYLDGRYFNRVLEEYPGLNKTPIVFRISEKEAVQTETEGWQQEFKIKELSSTIHVNLNDQYPDLVRIIIEIARNGKVLSRHSNLLVVDPRNKTAYRFESLASHKYFFEVNDALELFVNTALPDYKFMPMELHPQKLEEGKCAGKGYCIGYTIKLATMFVTGQPLEFSEDPTDIYRFAAAVEAMFPLEEGEPDLEYGPGNWLPTLAGAGIGGLLTGGGLLGTIGGGLLGNWISQPSYYSPQHYGHNYTAPYRYNNNGWFNNNWRGGWPSGNNHHHHGNRGGGWGGNRGGGWGGNHH